MSDLRTPEIGHTVSIQKPVLNTILARLKEAGYETIGPRVKNETLVYEAVESLDDLPRGYITEQEAGRFRLAYTGHGRYFDVIPGQHSWKEFLFPPRGLSGYRSDKGGIAMTRIELTRRLLLERAAGLAGTRFSVIDSFVIPNLHETVFPAIAVCGMTPLAAWAVPWLMTSSSMSVIRKAVVGAITCSAGAGPVPVSTTCGEILFPPFANAA